MSKEKRLQALRRESRETRGTIREDCDRDFLLDEIDRLHAATASDAQLLREGLSIVDESERQLEEAKEKAELAKNLMGAYRCKYDRFREALEFYANPENYDEDHAPGNFVCKGDYPNGGDEWEADEGEIARQTLAYDKPKKGGGA